MHCASAQEEWQVAMPTNHPNQETLSEFFISTFSRAGLVVQGLAHWLAGCLVPTVPRPVALFTWFAALRSMPVQHSVQFNTCKRLFSRYSSCGRSLVTRRGCHSGCAAVYTHVRAHFKCTVRCLCRTRISMRPAVCPAWHMKCKCTTAARDVPPPPKHTHTATPSPAGPLRVVRALIASQRAKLCFVMFVRWADCAAAGRVGRAIGH